MNIGTIHGLDMDGAQAGDPACDELLAEWDTMDCDLGVWLARRAAQLGSTADLHRRFSSTYAGLTVGVWRTLVLVWATSPHARARYSPESRSGLVAAAQSMDDELLLDLVAGLVGEASNHPPPNLAAAA